MQVPTKVDTARDAAALDQLTRGLCGLVSTD